MSKVTIHRKSHYANYFRKIRIYIDGQFSFALSDDELKEFDIAPGTHSLKAKIDWQSSNEVSFTISQGEKLRIELGSSMISGVRGILFPLLRFLLLMCSLVISDYFENPFIFWLTLLLLISWYISEISRKKGTSLIFFFTTGRKQALYMKQLE